MVCRRQPLLELFLFLILILKSSHVYADSQIPGSDCKDSTEPFDTYSPIGLPLRKKCGWVARTKTHYRCTQYPNVADFCPETCGKCGCSENTENFIITEGYFLGALRSCRWAADKIVQRCDIIDVQKNCPKTCGRCHHEASSTPSPSMASDCMDNEYRFKDEMGEFRTCNWADRKYTWKRCKKQSVRNNCPLTCGSCEEPVFNEY